MAGPIRLPYPIRGRSRGFGDIDPNSAAALINSQAGNQPVAPYEQAVSGFANYFTDILYLTGSPVGLDFAVGTSPTLILNPPYQSPLLITNPSLAVGLTTTTTVIDASTIPLAASGNTEANPLPVANFLNAHFFLNVTAIDAGTSWDFNTQAYDPISTNWANSQTIFGNITTTGTYYANIGSMGLVTDLAIAYVLTGVGTITCTLSMVLKDGLGGSGSGLAKTVWIGSSGVSSTTGLPFFEGDSKVILPADDVSLWAVAGVATTIRVFKL